MSFNQEAFNQFVIEHQVIGLFDTPITLKSGRESNWYINWRPITSDPYLLDQLCDFICTYIADNNIPCDCIYGVPEGATKMGVIAQFKWAQKHNWSKGSHCLPMGRSKEKTHGNPNDRFFVGEPKGQTVVVEDVTSTGGSLIETLEKLKNNNVHISAAIGISNRQERRSDGKGVKEAIESMDIPYYCLSEASSLLPAFFKANPLLDKEQIDRVVDEFNSTSLSTLAEQ